MRQEIKELSEIIGGLSKTDKMPCLSWSTSASGCKVGSQLRSKPDSVCSKCYACKGNYLFPSVRSCLERRLESLSDLDAWTTTMIDLIAWHAGQGATLRDGTIAAPGFFRWHDSGDLQSVEHLQAIVEIARALPEIAFWLPTKEIGIVGKWIALHGHIPTNLVIRISGYYLKQRPKITSMRGSGVRGSGVDVDGDDVTTCIAPQQAGKCGTCRACWNRDIEIISYHQH